MKDQKSNCTGIDPALDKCSGNSTIDANEIERILRSHETVKEADVSMVRDENGKDLLYANVLLTNDHAPSNELKLELAWHVGAESGNFSVFKDIEFRVPEGDEAAGTISEVEFRTGIVHIAGHEIDTADVETALMDFDGVVHARVIGVPDKKKGETLKAFITLKDGLTPTNDLKTELAWHARIEVNPMIVFKDIEFGDFAPLEEKKGAAAADEATSGSPVKEDREVTTSAGAPDPDGMVIVDEVKEDGNVIRISSHRISTTEITRSLLDHPYIEDAAVVTVPDDKNGETMKAFVKLKEGVDPSNDLKLELAWHVMTDLKPISVFKSIELETSMPAPASGVEGNAGPIKEAIPTEDASPIEKLISKGVEDRFAHAGKLSDRVENILAMHGSVGEAIVIGVKDRVHGQALQAFVTLNDGYSPTEDLMEELAWHARTEIGPDVVFKSIKFRRFFPVTESRETLEALLKADAMEIPAMMSITIAD